MTAETRLAYGLLFLTPLLFSANALTARWVDGSIPPVAMAFWRWTLTLLFLVPYAGRHLVAGWRKKAALCGISTTGSVYITAQGAELDIALSAKKLKLEPTILCISDKKMDITGTFEMKADLKAKGDIDTIAKSLNGSFNISAKNGKIFKSRSLDKTLTLVNETENFKGELPDLDKTVVKYRVVAASGTIKEYILEVEKGVLDASTFGILAQGQLDIYNQTVDLNALVAPVNIIQRVVGKIPVMGYILGGNLVSIPVKIKGKMYDPEVTFLSPAAIGAAFLGIIERTIKLPINIIEPILPEKKQD